jgi:hypothetical protein
MTKTGARSVALLAVMAAASFLLSSCGGGPGRSGVASLGEAKTTTTEAGPPAASGPSGSSSPTEVQLLKYAKCIRAHGVGDFPDPVTAAGGGFAFRVQPDANPQAPTPQFQAAEKACQKDVPPSIAKLTPAQVVADGTKFAQCMRAHGEPGFPDPNGQGIIKINPTGILDPSSPQFQRAEKACQSLDNGLFGEVFTPGSRG